MSDTILFDEIIFGPLESRRLGKSLGINLLPTNSKICNFDCVYCECGWSSELSEFSNKLPTANRIILQLEKTLTELKSKGEKLDSLTFAGNGEPTLHPAFYSIIKETVRIRNLISPGVQIAVLSNGSTSHKKSVTMALNMVDKCILKMDAGSEELFRKINRPVRAINLANCISTYNALKKPPLIQTLFFRGTVDGKSVNNMSKSSLRDWIKTISKINTSEVMIYTLDRNTPVESLTPASKDELQEIAELLIKKGINTSVYVRESNSAY